MDAASGTKHLPYHIYAVIYHPPGLNKEDQEATREHISSTITKLAVKYKSARFFIYGDFNRLDMNSLKDIFKLKQIVTFPTRKDAMLDLILTDFLEYQEAPFKKQLHSHKMTTVPSSLNHQ